MLQFHRRHPFIADAMGIALVAATLGLMMLFRAVYVEPREWGAVCVTVDPPASCGPRAVTLWLQSVYGWGAAALYAGLLTLIHSPSSVSVAAVSLGAIAIVNQNATWGVLASCLGAWSWLRRDFNRVK